MSECLKFTENQMADTFFGFNTALNDHAERLGSSPEDIEGLEAEEEYDALNDETFGALENEGDLDDWEAQHEQLAEIAESSRHSNDIESFLEQLGLNDDDSIVSKDASVWAYELKNGDKLNASSVLDSSIKLLPGISSSDGGPGLYPGGVGPPGQRGAPQQQHQGPKLRTVEELERMLLNQAKPGQQQHGYKEVSGGPRFPPGFQPLLLTSSPGPGTGPAPGPGSNPWSGGAGSAPGSGAGGPPNLPPGLVRVLGHGGPRVPGPPPPPGFVGYHGQHGQPFPLPPHFTFPPPPRLTPLPPGIMPPRPHSKTPYPTNHAPHPGQHGPHPGQHAPHPGQLGPHPGQHGPHPGQHGPHPPHHRQHPHHPPPLHPPHHLHPHHHPQHHLQTHNHQHLHHHQQQQHQQQQQHPHHHNNGGGENMVLQQMQHHHGGGDGRDGRDEYAGLMNNREKQWLLNIQLLQVNTGTPYFDDYYYTVFKERQTKNKESSSSEGRLQQQQRFGRGAVRDGNAGHHRGAVPQPQVQQQDQNPVKKTYTPLQFENSLGKLQFGSVTAPRKIIDMDIIPGSDSEPQASSRDSRKTKQLLLELEALYSLLLRAEDLRNPVAHANQEKLVELRQKQRIREMDAAPTPEQKQEVLRLLQAESLTPRETPEDLLTRLLSSLLDTPPPPTTSTPTTPFSTTTDRLTSFLGVRKGKMLVLRTLPQLALHGELFHAQLRDLWARVLAALPVVGRRDSAGDNVMVRLHPHFKRFINITDLDYILELVSGLTEVIKLENNRSTPLSHQSKAPLHFILQNKFGISAIATILQRVDPLLAGCPEKQVSDWSAFLIAVADTLSLVGSVSSPPLEPISDSCLARHVDKLTTLSTEKRQLLEKVFLESNQ